MTYAILIYILLSGVYIHYMMSGFSDSIPMHRIIIAGFFYGPLLFVAELLGFITKPFGVDLNCDIIVKKMTDNNNNEPK